MTTFISAFMFFVSLVVWRHHAARFWKYRADARWLRSAQVRGGGNHFIVTVAVGTELWARCERLERRGLLQRSPHLLRTGRWAIRQYVTTMRRADARKPENRVYTARGVSGF